LTNVEVIDSQLHLWEANSDARPWAPGVLANPRFRAQPSFTIAAGLESMAEAGVDAAIIASPVHYGYDASYTLAAAAAHPKRFSAIALIDPTRPDIEEHVATWRRRPGALGFRIFAMTDEDTARIKGGEFTKLLATAERHEVPICICSWNHLDTVDYICRTYPDLCLVVDHTGLAQPPFATHEDPFHDLPKLLGLAKHPNVAVKLTAVPTMSREKFPFHDIWAPLYRMIDAYGTERLMWGTDITRVGGHHTYQQGRDYVFEMDKLSESEREALMGKSLRRVFRWPS
jgi:L-fuconolactonase